MPVRLCYIVLNMKTTPTRQRIHTNMRAVPRLHYTGRKGCPEWVFRSVMKTPINSLRNDSFRINFTLVIVWQPVWTRSCTKLIRISCKRPLKVFVPRASLVAWKTNKKKKTQQQQFRLLLYNLFVFPLSVRIFALLYNAILWEILHIPLPKYGLSGVIVDW